MATNVQVFQDPSSGRWGVREVGDEETTTNLYASKEEAEREGRRLAEERGVDLLVHDETGTTEKAEEPG
ncbi:MAG TPA: DUF2188 domain-containing protein [Actinomycetota bacterium]|nr:DUF2188 domain-containing protein [Actinomycetota bacterium]